MQRGFLIKPTCDAGHFFHAAADACLLHNAHAATCTPANGFFWQRGDQDFDAVCLPCTDCTGMEETTACQADADASCASCIGALAANAHWTGKDCAASACEGILVSAPR